MAQTLAAHTSGERLRIHHLSLERESHEPEGEFAEDVRAGLSSRPKRLQPKYFYDPLGSRLFDSICLLPEYYLTRAEDEILARSADEIVRTAGEERGGGDVAAAPITLVEFGSGSAVKTRSIIEALLRRQPRLLYLPVDISPSALEQSARVLLQSYPSLRIEAYASDYRAAFKVLRAEVAAGSRVLALFLGSNIGNFDRREAQDFLRELRLGVLDVGDALLVGVDLKKSTSVLEAAYDDSLGVTAAFNLNLLARINRELEADFDLRAFRHVAFYNAGEGRVEIYIESLREQSVRIRGLGMTVGFAEGERLHTENSYKYDLAELSELAELTGFTRRETWLDDAQQFSSNLFIAR